MATRKSSKPSSKPTGDMRILKVGTCPSLSGASTLAYHLGCDSEKALHIRIWGNTGGGLFGREWVPWSAVHPVLDTDAPVTAGTLRRAGVCKGKSANTPGFLLAVLKAEGLVEPLETGGHTKSDPGDFLSEMQKLIDAGTDIETPEPTQRATR